MGALDLSVAVTDANGVTSRWGSEDKDPGNVPTGIQFRTQRVGGFADASCTLARRIDIDNLDVGLLDNFQLIGGDGSIAYEGYVPELPKSFDSDHSLTVQATGWIGHASDRTFTEIYVDRDLGAWREPSRARLVNLAASNYRQSSTRVAADETAGIPAIVAELDDPNWVSPVIPCSECWYDSGPGVTVGAIYYDWQRPADTDSASAWTWTVAVSAADDGSLAAEATANLKAASSTPAYFTPVTPVRFGRLFFGHTATPNSGADGKKFGLYWTKIAVYGNHGLPRVGTSDPKGVAASDVIKHVVANYAPLLNTRGVQATTYPIPHLVFKDRTKPMDAFLEVNKYHLWNLAVWENRTLHYSAPDLTDYDWEIRTDDPGTTINLQGDSADELANGVTVTFDNLLTGQRDMLTPDQYSDLRDTAVENPANSHGRQKWPDYQISYPTTTEGALQIGRMALAEINQPKRPGSITKTGMIRDRAGHLQPVWKVRANDRVAITSSANYSDRPRMIVETSYSHDGHQLTMGVDSTLNRLEGYQDRVLTALTAAGLG